MSLRGPGEKQWRIPCGFGDSVRPGCQRASCRRLQPPSSTASKGRPQHKIEQQPQLQDEPGRSRERERELRGRPEWLLSSFLASEVLPSQAARQGRICFRRTFPAEESFRKHHHRKSPALSLSCRPTLGLQGHMTC